MRQAVEKKSSRMAAQLGTAYEPLENRHVHPRIRSVRDMTVELKLLAWAIVLGLIHAVATGQFTIAQHGMKYGLSSRDEQKALTGIGARVQRAFANYLQTFPFFAGAVLIAHVAGRHSWLTVTGAYLYFWARVAYVPLYAFDITGARTIAFVASVAGIVLLLLALT